MAGKTTKTETWLKKGLFNNIRIELQKAVVEIGAQAFKPCEGIADGFGQWRFTGYPRELATEPLFKIVENRFGFELPQPHPFFR